MEVLRNPGPRVYIRLGISTFHDQDSSFSLALRCSLGDFITHNIIPCVCFTLHSRAWQHNQSISTARQQPAFGKNIVFSFGVGGRTQHTRMFENPPLPRTVGQRWLIVPGTANAQ